MTLKSEQHGHSHLRIVDSATRLLRSKGIAGARVADVMKGAGLTVGGFYAHFTSKEALIDDVLYRASQAMRDSLFAALDEKPAADRAVVILKRYLSKAHRDAVDTGCPLPAVVGEIATAAPEHRRVLSNQIQSLAHSLEEHLKPPAGITPRHLALGLVALMYGGLTLARALQGTTLSDEVLQACREVGILALRKQRPRSHS